jgi:ADP-ribose pyrophosphatase
MLPEKRLSSQQVYQGRGINLRVDTVQKPSGRKTTREVVGHSNCIVAVVLDDRNNVLLVRQFRYAVGKSLRSICTAT